MPTYHLWGDKESCNAFEAFLQEKGLFYSSKIVDATACSTGWSSYNANYIIELEETDLLLAVLASGVCVKAILPK